MKVSVAVCTYNGEKFLKKQLNSIITQSRCVDEIIISDDNSTDRTLMICEEILSKSDIAYKIIKNDVNLNVLKNFKQAFSACNGDIIFSCDQDDIWEKNKVEKIIDCFEANPNINMIATNASLIDEKDEVMNLTLNDSIGLTLNNSEEIIDSLLNTFCITGATMAFKKSFENDCFYLSEYWLHDGWLALAAALNNSLFYMNEKLTKYRLHGNNECGVSNVEILHHGNLKQLRKNKRKKYINKALRYPFYFEDYAKERKEMYKELQTQAIQRQWQVLEKNMLKLMECIEFWGIRENIRYLNFVGLIKMINDFRSNNSYQKYCESKYYFIFDVYFWLIYKLIPRRNKK